MPEIEVQVLHGTYDYAVFVDTFFVLLRDRGLHSLVTTDETARERIIERPVGLRKYLEIRENVSLEETAPYLYVTKAVMRDYEKLRGDFFEQKSRLEHLKELLCWCVSADIHPEIIDKQPLDAWTYLRDTYGQPSEPPSESIELNECSNM